MEEVVHLDLDLRPCFRFVGLAFLAIGFYCCSTNGTSDGDYGGVVGRRLNFHFGYPSTYPRGYPAVRDVLLVWVLTYRIVPLMYY